ncbi:MAG: hypothetical protein AB7F43_05075 [Bacteriovoracia bacterium]
MAKKILLRQLVSLFIAVITAGCLNVGTKSSTADRSTASSNTNPSGTTSSSNDACSIFSSNLRDYSTCLGCVTSLGSSVSQTQLIQCVHDNTSNGPIGGGCSIPLCGVGQIVDLVSCSCKDASTTPPFTPGVPGYDDQSTPYLRLGFSVSDRYCQKDPSKDTDASAIPNCMDDPTNANTTMYPRHVSQGPVNVFQDVGYIRWDLAIDATQYDVNSAMFDGFGFRGSSGSLIGNQSFFYQLKPNTVVYAPSGTIKWSDCAEHFGSYGSYYTTDLTCIDRSTSGVAAGNPNPAALSLTLKTSLDSATAGTSVLQYQSMSGGLSNLNLTTQNLPGNPRVATQQGLAQCYETCVDAGGSGYAISGDGNPTCAGASQCTSGLFSNIGYYKYTWGPITVRRPGGTTDIASGSVSGRIALNTNLGFTPASTIESTAFSPEGFLGTVPTRRCSTNVNNNSPCVVTALYRTNGGQIFYQNYSPRFPNGASSISALPSGINAVSTPKVIEDTSQLLVYPAANTPTSYPPAKLRAFVRADDGNIYMSRGERGVWNTWKNLGRPWTCDPATSTQCATDVSAASSLPQVYQPYDITAVGGGTDTINENDGLSIAGEPVVAAYMDEPTCVLSTGCPIKGYIAIFVRVSHLNSSTGLVGSYHNSVWYTIAAASNSTSTSLDFDNISTWSAWRPVINAGGTRFAIQGNPTAVINERNGTDTRVYLFGTESSTSRMHPPVVPNPLPTGTTLPEGFMNYGNTLTRTSLDISALTAASFASAITHDVTNAVGQGWVFASEPSCANAADCPAIISDWSIADTGTDTVRLFANQIYGLRDTTGAESLLGFLSAGATPTSYRDTRYYEYQFTSALSGTTSMCDSDNAAGSDSSSASTVGVGGPHLQGGGFYRDLRFLGTPQPISMGFHNQANLNQQFSGVSAAANRTDVCANPNNVPAASTMLIFGRTTCDDRFRCDTVNPTVAYAAVSGGPHCTGGNAVGGCTDGGACVTVGGGGSQSATMYYSSYAKSGGAVPATIYNRLRQLYVTSDVVVAPSNGLDIAQSDVPVYLLTRDSSGRLSHGYWGSYGTGTASVTCDGLGAPLFNFIQSGAFTN